MYKRMLLPLFVMLLISNQHQMAEAQNPGRGMRGRGRAASDNRHAADREVFQYLLKNHTRIKRQVKELENGVETTTESDDPRVTAKIKEHVKWMTWRIEKVNPIRMRDPLFAELFRHAKQIKMRHEETEKGVKVTETSEDPYVAELIQAHAKVVSRFVEHGFEEARKNHKVPRKSSRNEPSRDDQQ